MACRPGTSTIRVLAVFIVLINFKNLAHGVGETFSGHLFSLLPAYPSFTEIVNERCRNDSIILRQQLAEFKLWAVRMLDASSKLPSGVLAGNIHQLGHFDECLSVLVDLENGQRLRGQYCLARVEYSPKNLTVHTNPVHMLQQIHNTSAWNYIKAFSLERSKNRRDEIYWALCVPDSCSGQDVQTSMAATLRELQDPAGLDISVSVGPHMCQVAEHEKPLSWVGIPQLMFGAVVAFFISLVSLSTVLQGIGKIQWRERAGCGKFLNCFSIQNNFRALYRVDPSKDIMVVHTLRFLSMLVILMGHRFITDSPYPKYNADYFEESVANPALIYNMIGPVLVVDTFFLLSGFLTGNQIFNDLEAGNFKVFSFYFHRYIRLTPVYMLVVAFYALILLHIGSGPMWLSQVTIQQQRCAQNWWTNLLYINNYVNARELCMFQSWHLSCDFHFLLIAPPLVYFLWKRPKIAVGIILFLIGVCSALLFTLTFVFKLDPNLLAYKSVLSDLGADPTFRITYIPTHTRYGPYLFGLLTAFAYYKRKSIGVISEKLIYCITVIVIVLLHIPVGSAFAFYTEGFVFNIWTSSLYASLHRIPWTIATCTVIFVAATKNAYFFQNILSWPAFAPLSRLTYCVFLIHSAVQLYSIASARTPGYSSHFYYTWQLLGDVLMTYLLALLVHLIFEAPILRLDRTYWSTRKIQRVTSGKDNKGFAAEIPSVFSKANGPFIVTETEHEKYSNRQEFYSRRNT